MKNFAFLFLISFSIAAYAQQPDLLSKKVSDLNEDLFNQLIAKGYFKQSERALFGTFIIGQARQDTSLNTLTIGQMIDRYKESRKQMEHETAGKNNYGPDSVFIRSPDGSRFFAGMGQLSLEKLVTKYAADLPAFYPGELDQLVTQGAASAQLLSSLILKAERSWLLGNVMMIRRDSGLLSNHKLGDVAEITRRITESPEFKPFLTVFD